MGRKRDLVSRAGMMLARPGAVLAKQRWKKYQESPDLTVVLFHKVTDTSNNGAYSPDLTVTTTHFREYLLKLREHYTVCSFSEARRYDDEGLARGRDYGDLAAVQTGAEKPRLVVSFDDGYTDFYDNVFPIIRELGVKVNLNVIVKYADEGAEGYLNWGQIREMYESGLVEYGSHTYDGHREVGGVPVLLEMAREGVLEDLERAQAGFLEHLGVRPEVVAWPYGVAPRHISASDLAELGLKVELFTRSGVNFAPVDYRRILRFVALDYESPEKLLSIMEGYRRLGFALGRR